MINWFKNKSLLFKLVCMEVLSYIIFDIENLEMFFGIWIAIFTFIFLFNFFNIVADAKVAKIGKGFSAGGHLSVIALTSKLAEATHGENRQYNREKSKLLDPLNITLICVIALNIISYILIIPKV